MSEQRNEVKIKIAGKEFPAEVRVSKKGNKYFVARVAGKQSGLWPATVWRIPMGVSELPGLEIRLLRTPSRYMPNNGMMWFKVGEPVAGSQLWVSYLDAKSGIKEVRVKPDEVELTPIEG